MIRKLSGRSDENDEQPQTAIRKCDFPQMIRKLSGRNDENYLNDDEKEMRNEKWADLTAMNADPEQRQCLWTAGLLDKSYFAAVTRAEEKHEAFWTTFIRDFEPVQCHKRLVFLRRLDLDDTPETEHDLNINPHNSMTLNIKPKKKKNNKFLQNLSYLHL